MTQRYLLSPFFHSEFGFAMLALSVMMSIVYIGNPRIDNSLLCWHHIPETFCLCFLGAWISKIGLPKKVAIGTYLVTTLLTPIILGSPSFGIGVTFGTLLFLPFLLGFIVRKMVKE